jgi:uncharacterized protein YbaP (TraB family)
MTSKIDGYLNSNASYFVFVGAGHLVGKRGIIELIKNKSYVVKTNIHNMIGALSVDR